MRLSWRIHPAYRRTFRCSIPPSSYPTDLATDLKDYVLDIENVKPPKGTCQLRNGTTVEVTDASYGLTADKTQATCQSHTLSEFGRKD